MKCQILYSEKNIVNLSSAELAQRVVKVTADLFIEKYHHKEHIQNLMTEITFIQTI